MRAVAVFCVLGGHVLLSSYSSGPLQVFGQWLAPFGVVIFFGISGFLLYRQFLAARLADESVGEVTPRYLWRRAVRILPAYWVALTLATLWVGWDGAFSSHWWVFYGLLQVYNPSWLAHGLPIAWSLCVEATFYLVLPLIALVLAERGVWSGNPNGMRWEVGLLGGIAVLGLVWRMVIGSHPSTSAYLNSGLMGTISWFCTGMLLAAVQVAHPASLARPRRWLSRPEVCWPVAVACFAFLLFGIHEKLGLPSEGVIFFQTVFYGLAASFLLAPAILGDTGRVVELIVANRTVVFFGTISYGIYLWHYSMLAWLDTSGVVLQSPFPVVTLALLVTPLTLALATASWYLVEKPLMRRAKSVKAFRRVKRGEVELAEPPDQAEVSPPLEPARGIRQPSLETARLGE